MSVEQTPRPEGEVNEIERQVPGTDFTIVPAQRTFSFLEEPLDDLKTQPEVVSVSADDAVTLDLLDESLEPILIDAPLSKREQKKADKAAAKQAEREAADEEKEDDDLGVRGVLNMALNTFMYIAFGAVIIACVASFMGFWRLDTVLSGSMKPVFQPGSMVVAMAKPADSISPGQIIIFTPPEEYSQGVSVTHRVTSVEHNEKGEIIIQTKGDNNAAADPWKAVVTAPEVWVVERNIPYVGWVANWAQHWWSVLLGLILSVPMFSMALYHFRGEVDEDEDDEEKDEQPKVKKRFGRKEVVAV